MAIGLSHGGATMYSSERPSSEVHVGTMDGVVTLRRTAGGWEAVHRTLPGSHVHAIAFVGEQAFAGVYRGGVHTSGDGGETWARRDRGIGVRSMFSLAALPAGGRVRLYAGTEPPHLYYSDHEGASWTELPEVRSVDSLPDWRFAADPFEAHLKHINVHPADPAHLYVSIEVGGLLESRDGGLSWRDVGVPHPDVHRTLIDPRDPTYIRTTGGAGLLLTSDGGGTWEVLAGKENDIGAYPDQLVSLPSDPDVLFMSASQTGPRSWLREGSGFAGGRIGRSEDGGRTWTVLAGGLPDRLHGNVEAMCIEEAGATVSLFAGMTDGEVWWSETGGERWELIAELAPVSKSVHAEMLTGERTTALRFSDGEVAAKTTSAPG